MKLAQTSRGGNVAIVCLPTTSVHGHMCLGNQLVLFQGDSITHAFRRPEEVGSSYRLGCGWAMIVAGKLQAEHPELGLRFENRGVCGNRLEDLAARWQRDCLDLRPGVISLLVGVNDTLRAFTDRGGSSIDQFRAGYHDLIQRTLAALPSVRLVICEPFLLPCGEITSAHLDDLRPRQQIVAEAARLYSATFVPLQQPLNDAARKIAPEYWLFDGIHPNAPGQWLIARQWLSHVELPAVDAL